MEIGKEFGKEIGKDCETACRRAKKKTSSAISNMSFVGFWTDFEEILPFFLNIKRKWGMVMGRNGVSK